MKEPERECVLEATLSVVCARADVIDDEEEVLRRRGWVTICAYVGGELKKFSACCECVLRTDGEGEGARRVSS